MVAGGAAATAGLAWYLLREGDDEEEAQAATSTELAEGLLFKVSDPKGCSIGIREGPDLDTQRTGASLFPGEVFMVSEIVNTPGDQMYLKLADGRGWAFTHSGRDGRLLATPATQEDSQQSKSGLQQMMLEAHRLLERDPALREEVMRSPQVQDMLANPELLQQAASESASVAQALEQRPEVREALALDPAALAASLREAR